jgi:hypothetical protein
MYDIANLTKIKKLHELSQQPRPKLRYSTLPAPPEVFLGRAKLPLSHTLRNQHPRQPPTPPRVLLETTHSVIPTHTPLVIPAHAGIQFFAHKQH